MKEIWLDVHGYVGIYKCSNIGRLKSLRFNKSKVIKPNKDKNGYLLYHLRLDGKRKVFKAHRLVYSLFVADPKGKTINHIDGIKKNNFVGNLNAVSIQDNIKHAIDNGLINNKGECHGNSVYRDGQILEVKLLASRGKTPNNIARLTGISANYCRKIIRGEIWKHVKLQEE